MKYCKHCGAQLEDSDKFCTSCGEPCDESTPKVPSKKPFIIGAIAGVVVLVVLLIFLAVFVFANHQDDSDQASGSVQIVGEQPAEESAADSTDADQINATEKGSAGARADGSEDFDAATSDEEKAVPHLSSNITGSYPGLVVPFEKISASSTLESSSSGTYYPSNIADGNNTTAWVEGDSGSGAGAEITFSKPTTDKAISEMALFNGYCKNEDLYYANARPHQITIFADGVAVGTTALIDDYSALQVVQFDDPIKANVITLRIDSVYEGSRHADCCISEIGFR